MGSVVASRGLDGRSIVKVADGSVAVANLMLRTWIANGPKPSVVTKPRIGPEELFNTPPRYTPEVNIP